ncbi:MAG: hypothetical protein IMZ55_16130 [Acidobacteria bacterium]|nr:hypothetical protein [Spirochaetota bacterium]MBE3134996.1 hypothetical protein [Acidobacteriota bacterium]
MGKVERSARRHFEKEIRAVRVTPPVVPAGGERRTLALAGDALVRMAAVIVAAGSLVLLAGDLPRETPLRQAIATIARERTYERYLPSTDLIRHLIDISLNRRKTE